MTNPEYAVKTSVVVSGKLPGFLHSASYQIKLPLVAFAQYRIPIHRLREERAFPFAHGTSPSRTFAQAAFHDH